MGLLKGMGFSREEGKENVLKLSVVMNMLKITELHI